MSLDSQINIYSVDTGNFYSKRERRLHWRNAAIRRERNYINNKIKILSRELCEYGYNESDLKYLKHGDVGKSNLLPGTCEFIRQYVYLCKLSAYKRKMAYKTKDQLLLFLGNKVEQNELTKGKNHTRTLDESTVSEKNIISIFDSSLTRTMGIGKDEFTDNIITVQIYYFDVFKDISFFGFKFKGEKYRFYTSSAGQIRAKKAVFIKESVWEKYEKTIMCGLTVDTINDKGGNNVNKHMAYTALTNSATDLWTDFDIDKTIVIDDFETEVFGTYDLIDDLDYSINRISDYVPIAHTDGAGMILYGKNRMIRAPWIKGLLGVFDFRRLILEKGWSLIIKDIYGKEHNIITEDIQIIFTKSQFKMWKYYDSWEDYKANFKKFKCQAGYCKVEEDRIGNAKINYQMLQTLTDVTDEELKYIAQKSIDKITNLTTSIDSVMQFFGVTPYNHNMIALQESLKIYPNLLNDVYLKSIIRAIKERLVKRYKAGKLEINGKYTFILPDFYAACEYWFGHIGNPDGLLSDQEVYCRLFPNQDRLDCLRSPHLYKEHAVRNNIASKDYVGRRNEVKKWFNTNALYTSCHDLISKVLMFDVDGDTSLVVSDPKFVDIAERNMRGIVPLYYNMRKAAPEKLTPESIFNGLITAFTGGNIGPFSNGISGIWNDDVFVNGTIEEQNEAVDIVKLLCCENNFVIDYAKTLYKPTRPEEIDDKITKFTNKKLPHFFVYAKDKSPEQVQQPNGSFVNRLEKLIPNPRLNFRNLGIEEIDYSLLMHNPYIKVDERVIAKYKELNKQYHFKINLQDEYINNLRYIACSIRYDMAEFGHSDEDICDMLILDLYGGLRPYKETLWFCYGEYILHNLKINLKPKPTKYVQCIDCSEWFEVSTRNTKTDRCPKCQLAATRKYEKEKKRKQRQKIKCPH